MKSSHLLALIGACGLAGAASAQVVINEVFVNPPGSGSSDDAWEYVELYGKPGMKLDGYMIAQVMGGADENGDNVPGPLPLDWDAGDHIAEIDEAFHLDGLVLGANGLLVLHNNTSGGTSNIPALSDPQTALARWKQRHVPSPIDPAAGRLRNDGSCTMVLVRRRPGHSLNESGQSVYGANYHWWKDVEHDVNFDGKIDCGTETIVPPNPAPSTPVNPARPLEPYQMVDDVAWSNAGGKEYVRSSQQELSDTPGFNPDAVSRVAFYPANPERGHRFAGSGELDFSRMADEEFVYGEVPFVGGATGLFYNVSSDPVNAASLAAPGYVQPKGPTDPNGPRYDGTCNPDAGACAPVPGGEYLFQDMNLRGYRITPGRLNDVNASAVGGPTVNQFRFVAGDVTFDGIADLDDLRAICGARGLNGGLGASLDDTEPRLCEDGVTMLDAFVYEGRSLQAMLAMTHMNTADGPGGANDVRVTTADVNALRSLLGFGNIPDQNGDGFVNSADLASLLGAWGTDSPVADVNCDGLVNSADLAVLLGGWG